MKFDIQKIVFLFSIIISLFCPTVAFAARSEDVYISVSADKDTSEDVESGDDIVFTVTVKNTSEEDKLVKLKCKQNKWSKEVNVSSGSIERVKMTYTVPDDIKGGESIKFDFSGICDGEDVAGDGDTYFSFYTEEIEDLRFKVQLEKNKDKEFSVGDTLNFEILVENKGNVDIDSIEIEHSLGDEKVKINSLAPGTEKTVSMKYQIPNTIRLNESVTDSFFLNADGISEMVKDITFYVLAEAEVEAFLYLTPEVYSVNDTISAVLSIKNIGATICENLSVTNSKDRNWQEKIDYLAEGGTTRSDFSFVVSQEEDISFYVRDQDGKLLSEQTIKVYPTEKKENSSTDVDKTDSSDNSLDSSSLTPITDNMFTSGGGSIDLSLGSIDDTLSGEIDSVLTQDVENSEFIDTTISNSVENNKIVNNSTSSTSTNNQVNDSRNEENVYQDTVVSENEVELPKTGEYKFYRLGAFFFLFLGVAYLKIRHLHI